uniref:Alpha-L-fucosidase n=1 Tax=Fagus sylvatica TaxID=28930 RepID=A0A2N9HWK9_FAGSY
MDWAGPINLCRRWRGPWALSKIVEAVAVVFFLVVGFSIFMSMGRPKTLSQIALSHPGHCNFPAIFNFGDSNSDTGGKSAAFSRLLSPNGDTFFGKPSGRYCDGQLVIDFIAEKLGLPYLSAYLDSIGTNFRHGANFATAGSTIQPVDAKIFEMGFSPISLDIQLSQFEQFKARIIELYKEGRSSYVESSLPRPEDFSKALYTLDIGQNDLHGGFSSMTEKQVLALIPNIINQVAQAVELQERVSRLRVQLPDSILTYVDIFSAKYTLISEAKKLGFTNPHGYCCGHIGDYSVECGKKAMVNGTEVTGASCSNPSVYISWDGVHYSHAANKWIANQILNGSLSNPPIPITDACHNPVNS